MARNSRYNACNVGRLARRYLDAVPPPIPGGPFSIREPFDATSRLPSNPRPRRRGHSGRRLGPRRERATCPARRLSGAWRPAAAAPRRRSASAPTARRRRCGAIAARRRRALAVMSGPMVTGIGAVAAMCGCRDAGSRRGAGAAGARDNGAGRGRTGCSCRAAGADSPGHRPLRDAQHTIYIVCVELTPPSAVEAAFPQVAAPPFRHAGQAVIGRRPVPRFDRFRPSICRGTRCPAATT